MNTGRWHEVKEAALPGANVDALISLRNVKDELCSNAEQNLILKGTQLVIPAKLQHRVAHLAHEGHQGMSNTKSFIRSKVWFPNIDKAVEEFFPAAFPVRQTNRCTKEPLCMSELPRGPWLNLSVEFCGPLPTGEYLLVIVDEYSRYPVVEIVRSTSAECAIPLLQFIHIYLVKFIFKNSEVCHNCVRHLL